MRTTETLLIFSLLLSSIALAAPTEQEVAAPKNTTRPGAHHSLDLGPLPVGLPNWSAQGCQSCHTETHIEWAGSTHATGWSRPRFTDAVENVDSPLCVSCHLPLRQQHTLLEESYNGERRWSTTPNTRYDPTLHTEGITCAVCHIRSGAILATSEHPKAPHPIKVDPDLGTSKQCAACHELNVPGANQPIYRTYTEWAGSPQAAQGIQCQDCHMRQTKSGAGHSWSSRASQAISVLLNLSTPITVRGGEPTLVTLTVQNTGTGHNVPTGAPFKVVHIEMDLLYERRSNDWRTSGTPFKETLARTVTTTPPYDTVEDTSLLPGETRQWTWPISLPITASAGPWEIRVRVYKSSAKNIREDLFENRFPVRVH